MSLSGLCESKLLLLHALTNEMLKDASLEDDPKSVAKRFKLKDHYGPISLAPYANSFSGTAFVRWIVLRKSEESVQELMEHAVIELALPSAQKQSEAFGKLFPKVSRDLQAAELIGKWMRKEQLIVHVELEQCFKAKRNLFYRFTTSETDQYQEVLRFGQEAPYRVNCTFLMWAIGAIAVLIPYFVSHSQAIAVLPLAYLVVLTSCILQWTPPELLQEEPGAPKSLLACARAWFQSRQKRAGTAAVAAVAEHDEESATVQPIKPIPAAAGPDGTASGDRGQAIEKVLEVNNQYTGCCQCLHPLWLRFTKSNVVKELWTLLNGDSSVSETVSKFFGVYDDVRTHATVPWIGLLLLFGMALLAYMLPITLALMKHHKYATCRDSEHFKYELTTTYSRCTVKTKADPQGHAWMHGMNITLGEAKGWKGPVMVSTTILTTFQPCNQVCCTWYHTS
jgi:hypothetical protein